MFMIANRTHTRRVNTPTQESRSRSGGPVSRPSSTFLLVVILSILVAGTAFLYPREAEPTGVVPNRAPATVPRSQDPPRVNRDRLIRDLSVLAHDSMEGRLSGTAGNERARRFIISEFQDRGVAPLLGTRTQSFPVPGASQPLTGMNVFGAVEGREAGDRYIVVSAHYDHLGLQAGSVYNGADDNASGTAALLAIASYFLEHPPRHSLLLVAFDAEERGLVGARAFISDPPVPLSSVVLNVNLDMVSRSEAGELYAAGTHHYPSLVPLVEEAASRAEISLLIGHDAPTLPSGDDWTYLSDHGAFHEANIPFLYFGVEDHPDYHRTSDTFDKVDPDFYLRAVETILDFIRVADREL